MSGGGVPGDPPAEAAVPAAAEEGEEGTDGDREVIVAVAEGKGWSLDRRGGGGLGTTVL